MVIQKFKNSDELSQAATKKFIGLANQAIAERGCFLVSLSGGNTPMKLYERLANETLEWAHVHFFWGDERCVPVDDPGNNYGQTKKIFFDKIGKTNIHRIESELEPTQAAHAYAQTLNTFSDVPFNFPRFDLVLLGMGYDGHTASLFPGSPIEINTSTITATAHYQNRPAKRVSLTPIVFNQAREIWFLVTGAGRAEILSRVMKGSRNLELYPAQRIQPKNGKLIWMVDEAAGELI